MATALASQLEPGETVTVNLGTSAAYSVMEVIEKLRSVSRISFAVEADRDRARAVDRPFLAADTAMIRQRFGWTPELTVDDAMADLWRNPDLSPTLSARYE